MKKARFSGSLPVLLGAIGLIPVNIAMAQSSGNFAASINTTQCEMNTVTGGLFGGILPDEDGNMLLSTSIKTPNSGQTALLITPSLVTGLYTNTQITEDLSDSGVTAGVVVKVTLDGEPVLPATDNMPGVVYDKRFQRISTNLFSMIDNCDDQDENEAACFFNLTQSTLSAHSFNFIAPAVGGGDHQLEVSWEFECFDNSGQQVACATTLMPNTAAACAGPGTVTVQQVKTFTQSGGITVK